MEATATVPSVLTRVCRVVVVVCVAACVWWASFDRSSFAHGHRQGEALDVAQSTIPVAAVDDTRPGSVATSDDVVNIRLSAEAHRLLQGSVSAFSHSLLLSAAALHKECVPA